MGRFSSGTGAAEPAGSGADPTAPTGGGSGRPVPRSRAGGLWVAIAAFAVLLLVLLIFILQNSRSIEIRFLVWGWGSPIGVALLLAAVAGALLVVLAGTVRIIQLRLLAGRRRGRTSARR